MEAALIGPQGRMALGPVDITIGRASHNTIVLSNDPRSSGNHAMIRATGNGYSVVDLGSTNGTFVNEQRLQPHAPRPLMPNDAIRVGDTVFHYEAAAQFPQTVFDNGGIPATVAAPPPFPATVAAPAPYNNYNRGEVALPDLPQLPANLNNNRANRQAPKIPKQQPAQPQRRRNPLLPIIGILVLLIILTGGFFALKSALGPHSTPDQTLATFCNDLQTNNYHDAYQQLSSNAQHRETEQQFTSSIQEGFAKGGGLKSCSPGTVTTNGNTASSTMLWTFNAFAGQTVPVPTQLIPENGIWKIDSAKPAIQGAPSI